jgi:hypothetical protein
MNTEVRETIDEVAARRDRIDRLNKIASRTGYGLWVLSTVAFFAGLWTDYTSAMHLVSGVALVVGSVILAPSIVITYGIRAARREDAAEAAKKSGEADPRADA